MSADDIDNRSHSIEHLMTRGIDSPFEVLEVFVGRDQEREVFRRSLAATRADGGNVPRTLDMDRAAENVLVFSGIAGIGKSSLSRQLERELTAGAYSPKGHPVLAYRVDFGRGALPELEEILLGLRIVISSHPGPWTAFDIALSVYWERAHPGEPLRVELERRPLGRLANRSGVLSQIDQAVAAALSTVDELAGSFGSVTFARNASKLVADKLVHGIRERQILRDNPYVKPIIEEADPPTLLAFLPALLGWDLARAQHQQPVDVVVFFDTWDEVARRQVERGSLEDLISRLVFLLPDALFVISGRDPLKWAAEERQPTMLYAGPTRWPRLVEASGQDEPRQHRLEGLEREEALGYVRERLKIRGQTAIPGRIAAEIVDGSEGGWPEYLRLSVERFEQIVSLGETPQPESFGGAYPELVGRILRDLGDDERELLRAAALLGSYDLAMLLAATGGTVRRPAAKHFSRRLFVDTVAHSWPPHSLHPAFAQAVRNADAGLEDSWDSEDWALAAERALSHLEGLLTNPRRGSPGTSALGTIFSMIVDLVSEFQFVSGVLPEVAVRLGEAGRVQTLRSLSEPGPEARPELQALYHCVQAMWVGPSFDADSVLDDLGQWEKANLDARYVGLLLESLGAASMAAGRLEGAEETYRRMASEPAPFNERSRHGLAGIAWRKGDLRGSLDLLSEVDFRRGMIHPAAIPDLAGLVRLSNGEFPAASDLLYASQERAEEEGSALWYARATRHRAIAMAWSGANGVADQISTAQLANIGMDHNIGTAQCQLAEAIVASLHGEDDNLAQRLVTEASELLSQAGATYDLSMAFAVKTLIHLRAGRRADAERTYAAASADETPVYPAVIEIWLDLERTPAVDVVRWIDSRSQAARRWSEALDQ